MPSAVWINPPAKKDMPISLDEQSRPEVDSAEMDQKTASLENALEKQGSHLPCNRFDEPGWYVDTPMNDLLMEVEQLNPPLGLELKL